MVLLQQDNWIAHKLVDEFSRNEDVVFATESTSSANMSDNHAECVSNKPEFLWESCQVSTNGFILYFSSFFAVSPSVHCLSVLQQQEQVSESANNSLSQKKSDEEEAELSFGEAQREQDPSVHEDILLDCSDLENPFGEAYITKTSSKRKQALRMRKRPVLAIGNNFNAHNHIMHSCSPSFIKVCKLYYGCYVLGWLLCNNIDHVLCRPYGFYIITYLFFGHIQHCGNLYLYIQHVLIVFTILPY